MIHPVSLYEGLIQGNTMHTIYGEEEMKVMAKSMKKEIRGEKRKRKRRTRKRFLTSAPKCGIKSRQRIEMASRFLFAGFFEPN